MNLRRTRMKMEITCVVSKLPAGQLLTIQESLRTTEKLFFSDVKASVKRNKHKRKEEMAAQTQLRIFREFHARTERSSPKPQRRSLRRLGTGAPRNKHDAGTALASSRIGLGTLAESPTRAPGAARKHVVVSPVLPHTRSMDRACNASGRRVEKKKKKNFYPTPATCSTRVERPRRVDALLNNDPCWHRLTTRSPEKCDIFSLSVSVLFSGNLGKCLQSRCCVQGWKRFKRREKVTLRGLPQAYSSRRWRNATSQELRTTFPKKEEVPCKTDSSLTPSTVTIPLVGRLRQCGEAAFKCSHLLAKDKAAANDVKTAYNNIPRLRSSRASLWR